MVTLKPTTPLLAPNKGLLKPASPLHPKNAPKTPISHPQRRWWFQPHTDSSKQRRWRFQSRLGRRPQRRWWFQTGPPGRQGQTAVPVGGGRAWPDNEAMRQDRPQHTRHRQCGGRRRDLPRCRWAAAGPGRASTQRTEPHVSTPNAAGVEGAGGSGGHGRASRSTTPSRRLACGDLAGGRARRRPEHQRSHKQQHTARTSRGRAAAHRHTQRPGPPAPGTPVGPQQNETATGFPATASSRSRSAVHNSTASDQAVMST